MTQPKNIGKRPHHPALVTHILNRLYWLPVKLRRSFKIPLFTYKVLAQITAITLPPACRTVVFVSLKVECEAELISIFQIQSSGDLLKLC